MWSPDSWREKSALQQPDYADPAELERVLADLHALPPLVTSWEILRLRDQLAEAAEGRQFVLQAGDCAERFVDCTPPPITKTPNGFPQHAPVRGPPLAVAGAGGGRAPPGISHWPLRRPPPHPPLRQPGNPRRH